MFLSLLQLLYCHFSYVYTNRPSHYRKVELSWNPPKIYIRMSCMHLHIDKGKIVTSWFGGLALHDIAWHDSLMVHFQCGPGPFCTVTCWVDKDPQVPQLCKGCLPTAQMGEAETSDLSKGLCYWISRIKRIHVPGNGGGVGPSALQTTEGLWCT